MVIEIWIVKFKDGRVAHGKILYTGWVVTLLMSQGKEIFLNFHEPYLIMTLLSPQVVVFVVCVLNKLSNLTPVNRIITLD